MSTTDALLAQILAVLETTLTPLEVNTNTVVTELNTTAQATMKQAQAIMTRTDPVLDRITRIETFVFVLLIVFSVMLLAFFLFWFFRHVYPLIRHQHTHAHTSDTIIKDLTDVPVRIRPDDNRPSTTFGVHPDETFNQSFRKDFGSALY